MASSTFQLELIRFDGGAARTAATLVGVSQVCVCVCVCVCVRRLMNAKKKSKRRTKRKIGCCWRSRPDPPISSHLLRSLLRLPVSLERNQFFFPGSIYYYYYYHYYSISFYFYLDLEKKKKMFDSRLKTANQLLKTSTSINGYWFLIS